MLRSLLVLHRPKADGKSLPAALPATWFHWETCLRQIAVGFVTAGERGVFLESWEIREGEDGYRFLLEVICGLHSPIKGETEVLGQFRTEADAFRKREDANGFAKLFQSLFRDAKQVREKFLSGTGSQSYGSVARRVLEKTHSVQILGAGQLVEEILPWIQTGTRELAVFCRDPKRGAGLLEKFPGVQVGALTEFTPLPRALSRALVVAAPMRAAEIEKIAADFGPADILLDFRADSHLDRIAFAGAAHTLADVFADLRASADSLCARGAEAEAAIALLARREGERVHYRPFGWEDVCA